ncbi:MAG: heparinase II/III family protein [Planctomycetes bacterium]|nr:heparinase II/III family protein [Planctomycetota bacterium]
MFHPNFLIERARANVLKYPWAAEIRDSIVEAARPWMRFSDDDLWGLVFGNTITRSWMVWSNGHCPSCRAGVPMYTWKMDAIERPWKVQCPHCSAFFPKNDFQRFYRSGLDEHGVFDPKRADRGLLRSLEHPDAADPLHLFGVDDGEGYVEGGKRWRFIGAYLIYGQWKQAIVGGITRLAAAHVVTGDRGYAHRAAILLDRVADLYPTFDFGLQGSVYERKGDAGYVSTWHDACEETREMVLSYDQVREAIGGDAALIDFLSGKARRFGLENPKASADDVRRNIEERLLRDAIRHRNRIHSNYPRTEIALAVIRSVLGGTENEREVERMLGAMIEASTAVDGVTGEKGLAGYSAYVIQGLAAFLALWNRAEPGFLSRLVRRHPRLHQTYRFHIDTWCLHRYYPLSGDTGLFAKPMGEYAGVVFSKSPGLNPSLFTFLVDLAAVTGDRSFLQVVCDANGGGVEGLPHDLFATDPEGFQNQVREAVAVEGPLPRAGSCNKEQWCIAILRSGRGPDARALWLDYDSGGGHGHADGLNVGLFARGLDLLPDFGYPPVNYGGWDAPRARWYRMSAAHHTVIVDGRDLPAPWRSAVGGRTTLWADGGQFRAVRAEAPDLNLGSRYERTVALIDVSDRDFYVFDLFRVKGGSEHLKLLHSHFGRIETRGMRLEPIAPFGDHWQMRQFLGDPSPQPGWSADWLIEDRYGLLPKGAEIHLRYTDWTAGAEALTAEGWVAVGDYNANQEAWIPRVMVRRRASQLPLESTFVGLIEPYERVPLIARTRRLPVENPASSSCNDGPVALEVAFTNGGRDLLLAADPQVPAGMQPCRASPPVFAQKDWSIETDAALGMVRLDASGQAVLMALCQGTYLKAGQAVLRLKHRVDFAEAAFEKGRGRLVAGTPEALEEMG